MLFIYSDSFFSNGAGNKCCYRSDGSLIVGSPSGGSVDKIAPTGSRLEWLSNVYGHFFEDVVPFIYCCRGSKTDCGKYYERRPSDDASSFVNVTPPGKQRKCAVHKSKLFASMQHVFMVIHILLHWIFTSTPLMEKENSFLLKQMISSLCCRDEWK